MFCTRYACCTSYEKKVVVIIADRVNDRNFRYAGKKGLPRETVHQFPVERTDTGEQFLQALERSARPSVPLSAYQGILWR